MFSQPGDQSEDKRYNEIVQQALEYGFDAEQAV